MGAKTLNEKIILLILLVVFFPAGLIYFLVRRKQIKEITNKNWLLNHPFVTWMIVVCAFGLITTFSETGLPTGLADSNVEKESQNSKNDVIITSFDDIFLTRSEITTEFKIGELKNLTLSDYPVGFEEGRTISAEKLVGQITYGLITVDFNAIRFKTTKDATIFYEEKVNKIINDGGYKELNIKLPDNSNCFSISQDYGYDARFAISNCLLENIAYQVTVTSTQTYEKPNKYLTEMLNPFHNRVALFCQDC